MLQRAQECPDTPTSHEVHRSDVQVHPDYRLSCLRFPIWCCICIPICHHQCSYGIPSRVDIWSATQACPPLDPCFGPTCGCSNPCNVSTTSGCQCKSVPTDSCGWQTAWVVCRETCWFVPTQRKSQCVELFGIYAMD